jgi:hypothetical protein
MSDFEPTVFVYTLRSLYRQSKLSLKTIQELRDGNKITSDEFDFITKT